jgi:S1-C subfamily serine protease
MRAMLKTLGYALLTASLISATACAREATEAGAEASTLQVERAAPTSAAQIQLSFAPIVREAAPAVVNVYSAGSSPSARPSPAIPSSSVFSDRRCASAR